MVGLGGHLQRAGPLSAAQAPILERRTEQARVGDLLSYLFFTRTSSPREDSIAFP